MADDLRGDALAHLAFGLGIDRQREIRVRLDIDKARSDGETRHVDLAAGLPRRIADGGNAASGDGEVATCSRTAAAVIERAAAQDEIVHLDGPGRTIGLSRSLRVVLRPTVAMGALMADIGP